MKLKTRHTLFVVIFTLIWLTFTGFIITAHPVLAQDTTPVPDVTQYVVQLNDTLNKIALRFGTTVQRIVELNNLTNPSLIYEGQVLLIPADSSDFVIAGITPTATPPIPTATPSAPGTPPTAGSVAIPEPTSIALMGLGLAGLAGYIRRQRKEQ